MHIYDYLVWFEETECSWYQCAYLPVVMINSYKIWMPGVNLQSIYRQERLIIILCRESCSPHIAFSNQMHCFLAFPAFKLLACSEKWGTGAHLQPHIPHEFLRHTQDEVIVIVRSNYGWLSEVFPAKRRTDWERSSMHVKYQNNGWTEQMLKMSWTYYMIWYNFIVTLDRNSFCIPRQFCSRNLHTG